MGEAPGTSFFATATVLFKDAVFPSEGQGPAQTPKAAQKDRAGARTQHFNLMQGQLPNPCHTPTALPPNSSPYLSAMSSSDDLEPRLHLHSTAGTLAPGPSQDILDTDVFEVAYNQAVTAPESPPPLPSGPLETLREEPQEEDWSEGSESDWHNAFGDDVQILSFVGRGAFGSVYKALWRDELIALKVH